MAAGRKGREPRATSLLVSVTLHVLAGLGVAASSWWWGAPALEAWKTHTVALVDAPLSLQSPSSLAAPPQASPPKDKAKAPAAPKPNTHKVPAPPVVAKPEAKAKPAPKPKPKPDKAPAPKPVVKTPVPTRKPKVAKPAPKPEAKPPAPAKPAPPPSAASSKEARSAIDALRQRQAARQRERQQAEAARQQTASQRVAALREQLEQQRAIGGTAVTSAGVQRVRLMAYQDRVQAKIEAAWILPLSDEQRRDLQATAQFQVTRSGQVVQLELVKPSGNTLFDASLLRAIRRASPLPTLPDDYPLDVLEVEMRFRGNS